MFPQEIYDHIIDSVHDNPTLVSCALVSRNWHPRSRHRFFQDSRIPIDSVDKCQNLVSLACRPVAGCRPITQYVRHVEILLPLQDKNSQYCQSETYEDLYDALSQLTRLTSLIFNYEFTMVEYAKSWHCDMYPIFDADFLDGLIPILRNSDTFNALRIGSYIRFPDIPHLDKLLTVFAVVLDPNAPDQVGDDIRAELIALIKALNAQNAAKIQAAGLTVFVSA